MGGAIIVFYCIILSIWILYCLVLYCRFGYCLLPIELLLFSLHWTSLNLNFPSCSCSASSCSSFLLALLFTSPPPTRTISHSSLPCNISEYKNSKITLIIAQIWWAGQIWGGDEDPFSFADLQSTLQNLNMWQYSNCIIEGEDIKASAAVFAVSTLLIKREA